MAHIPTEVRRQQFIDAAAIVVARDGVDGATTRRIAEEAGAPLATLHYCFQTKENLLWALFEQLAASVRLDMESAATPGLSTPVIAGQLLRQAVEWGIERPDHTRAQIEIWLWAERNDPTMAVRMYDAFLDACQLFLRGAKTPLPEDEIESVARIIVALLDGLCMQLITHGDTKKLLRETDTAMAMLESYLKRRPRRND